MEITLLYELTRAQTSYRQALRYLSQVVTHLHLISTSLQYFSIILLFSVSHYLYIVLLIVVLSPRPRVFTESPTNSLIKYLLASPSARISPISIISISSFSGPVFQNHGSSAQAFVHNIQVKMFIMSH